MDRFDRLREHINVTTGRGLEIGPLASPIVPRTSGDISYVDHLSTADLIAIYKNDPGVDERKIVSTDFIWGSNSLAEAVGASAAFDYVVASHVLEHVPDLVGWLGEVVQVLRPGGRLATQAATTTAYLDTHCWVFSDAAFVDLMTTLMQMGLVTLPFVAFRPTNAGDFEFFVTLERPVDGLSPEQLRSLCLASVPTLPDAAPNSGRTATAAASSSAYYVLSDRETALIDTKRKAMASIRGVAARVKARR